MRTAPMSAWKSSGSAACARLNATSAFRPPPVSTRSAPRPAAYTLTAAAATSQVARTASLLRRYLPKGHQGHQLLFLCAGSSE